MSINNRVCRKALTSGREEAAGRNSESEDVLSSGILVGEEAEQHSTPNINDVLQAIAVADPNYLQQAAVPVEPVEPSVAASPDAMFGGTVHQAGRGAPSSPLQPLQPQHQPEAMAMFTRIVEQPASKALRFRYECEGRSAGSIPGARSTAENKTYPSIEIVGYRGRAVVVVSCVTKDKPYRAHPHNLVGKDLCKDGVCTVQINTDTNMTATFSNLGIQCVKKRDIEEALRVRERLRVDPFKRGYNHKHQPTTIDLNAVRLCFQVFVERDGMLKVALPPVVSDVIYDKKAMSELTICRLSHCAASVAGGQDVVLLCEKVTKEDIAVNFFELGPDGSTVWSADADGLNVHKQVAIAFRTPKYRVMQVDNSIQAFIQLKRPSDGATSEPRQFELTPVHSDQILSRKRAKGLQVSTSDFARMREMESLYDPSRVEQKIKLEPRDMQYGHVSPSHMAPGSNLNVYRNMPLTPSPQYLVPTPSPPPHPNYQYNMLDFQNEQQQWNILVDQTQLGMQQGIQPMAGPSTHPVDNQLPIMNWQTNQQPLVPTDAQQDSFSRLLHEDLDSLKQLNSSDLAGISSFLQPTEMEQDNVIDSFSRLRTDPQNFPDKL